jgi:hypothetical protein
MNWDQHAVQQLLLLFTNGVAAKTDLRGGNLTGRYQADGFATMEVGNPAAVSGLLLVIGPTREIRSISNGMWDRPRP